MKFPWFLLIFLFSDYCSGITEEDLKRILDLSNPDDPKCVFNHTEVTSETIKNFPKCSKVYGILVINSNTDLNVSQLKNAFKNMSSLVGGIHVENSNLTSLSFFTLVGTDFKFFELSCKNYGVIIQNNKNLSNAGALEKLVPFVDEDLHDCKFQIANNPILDLQNLCDGYTLAYLVNFETYGNLKNCGCQGNEIYPPTLFGFQNCTYFYNGLRLYNFSDTPDLKSLSNIVTIYGNIDIQNSNFQNLSFLESCQLLTVYTKNEEVVFNIQNCPNMTRLELPALKNLDNSNSNAPKTANFQNLHPDFCLTISDFWLFYELGVSFKNLHAKLCEYSEADTTEIENEELCIFESIDKLPVACKSIVGNVLIDSGNEKNAEKLIFVKSLFGSLTIRNTNLADLKFLDRLTFIVYLDDTTPVIEIVSNKDLRNPSFGKLFSTIFTRSFKDRNAVIQDNHPDIWNSTNGECNLFGLVTDEKAMYRTSLNYTGGDCGTRIDNGSTLRNMISGSILVIVFSLTHELHL